MRFIAVGVPLIEADWLIADRQTEGRGRHGRVWADGVGNFMGSTLVRLRDNDPPAQGLALMMAICLVDSLGDMIVDGGARRFFRIKWPNDILIGGAKVAGILLERFRDYVVIGVGVNLVVAPQLLDRKSISLRALGANISRDYYAKSLCNGFSVALLGWRGGDWPATIIARWMERAHPLGTALTLTDGQHAGLTGAFDGLEPDGGLRLRLADDRIMIIHAGELRLGSSESEGQDDAAGD